VPRFLSPEQKRVQAQTTAECLEVFQRNPADFKTRFVTMDETRIYHYTYTENKKSVEKVNRLQRKKVMATVFWDSKGILIIDYLQKGKIINGQYDTRS
jgi:histone-lysine N-methyltransferase SETMAR